MFAVLSLRTDVVSSEHTSNIDLSRVREDGSQEDDDDVERLQRQELEFIQKLLGSTTERQVDSTSPGDQLELPEGIQEDEQHVDDEEPQPQSQQQQLDKPEVEAAGKQQQQDEEDTESESQNYSESENGQHAAEDSVRQSPQQPVTGPPETEKPLTVNSQVKGCSATPDAQQGDGSAAGQQTVHVQVHMKTSPALEKKQQVAVVHAHERSYPQLEDRALSRIRNEEQRTSFSRQATIESHLSIDSTMSQSSLLWRNEQSPVGTRHQDRDQSASLQQQYEQLKYQLELQRSQLEREYQLREEQMKQQMMMQWQFFTQQQLQQQQWQMFSDVRQESDTRCQDDPRYRSFPGAPGSTNITSTCHPVAMQQVQPLHAEWTADRQRCGCCDGVVQSNNVLAAPATTQRNYHEIRPVVVDVMSHARGRGGGGAGHAGWAGYDGGHCRIIVGDGRTTTYDGRRRSSDVESVEQTGRVWSSGPAELCICPTCGLCRRQCDMSDGKDVVVTARIHVTDAFTSFLHDDSNSRHSPSHVRYWTACYMLR